jgi:hypothetical protein
MAPNRNPLDTASSLRHRDFAVTLFLDDEQRSGTDGKEKIR